MRAASPAAIVTGVKIGVYEVLGELGRGGMGVVYRVRAPDGREAALKLLVKIDATTFARFERERRLLSALGEAEGFVGLLDAGASAESAWLLMPFVPGGTLRRRLEEGPLGIEETIALGIQLATALGRAHERGIVHRDVKPENVLFSASGRALLADLGLAKHFDRSAKGGSDSFALTSYGVSKGTAGYLAPEQLEDATSAGPGADVFALGAVLHECLSGRPAFAGASVLDALARLSSGIVEPLHRPDAPPWLAAVVARALARSPVERFADGSALARALAARGVEKTRGARRGSLLALGAGAAVGAASLAAVFLIPWGPGRKTVEVHQGPAPPTGQTPAQQLVARAVKEAWSAKDEAMADLSKAIELEPDLAVAWNERGALKLRECDWDGAFADAARAIELDATFARAWSIRGAARMHKNDLTGALADATRAIELAPRFADAWVIRAGARNRRRDFDGALADATRAIELDPGLARAWQARGVARGEKNESEGALADFSKAIELDPRFAGAYADRGAAHGQRNELDAEIADETKAIELEAGLLRAWQDRSAARIRKGDWDGAILDATRATELDPRSADAWEERGVARGRKGDLTGALADLSRALELDDTSATLWANRGVVRSKAGDAKGAVADIDHANQLDPRVGGEELRRILAEARQRSGRY